MVNSVQKQLLLKMPESHITRNKLHYIRRSVVLRTHAQKKKHLDTNTKTI